jgi:hypothetical protein
MKDMSAWSSRSMPVSIAFRTYDAFCVALNFPPPLDRLDSLLQEFYMGLFLEFYRHETVPAYPSSISMRSYKLHFRIIHQINEDQIHTLFRHISSLCHITCKIF